ncbi:MAG: hypothetical protein ABIH34_03760 [Nanoarchaeota archaeon]
MARHHELLKKGWKKHEIQKTEDIIASHKFTHQKQEKRWYYASVILLILANILISLFLLPLMIITPTILFSLLMFFIGFIFGFFFEHLVLGMEHIQPKHKRRAAILIPLVAFIDLVLLTILGNWLRQFFVLTQPASLLPAFVFVGGFILPYLLHEHRKYISS